MPRTLNKDNPEVEILNNIVKKMLRVEMIKRDISYDNLVTRLNQMGLQENVRNVRNKIARGTMSASFFIHCMRALEVERLDLSLMEEAAPLNKKGPKRDIIHI